VNFYDEICERLLPEAKEVKRNGGRKKEDKGVSERRKFRFLF